jgi:hypothetical protein
MKIPFILKQILEGKPVMEVCVNNVTLEEDKDVISILEKGSKIETFQIEDSFIHEVFMEKIVSAIVNHPLLKSLSFKECQFLSEGPSFFGQEFFKNKGLEKLELIQVSDDEDLANFIKGLISHVNIKHLVIQNCPNIGEMTINALSQLVKINKNIKSIDVINNMIKVDMSPLITACKDRMWNPIQWEIEGSESIFDDKQLRGLIEVVSHKGYSFGSELTFFGVSQPALSEKKETSQRDFEKEAEEDFEKKFNPAKENSEKKFLSYLTVFIKKATQCGYDISEALEAAQEKAPTSSKDTHS